MDEQASAREHELLWARARAIVAKYPHLDVSGVYHTLRNLDRSSKSDFAAGSRMADRFSVRLAC